MLLESIIAMAMVGIIAAGPAYIASRATVSQTQTNMHAQAAMQLRNLLQARGEDLCPDSLNTIPSITVGTTSLAVTPSCTTLGGGQTVTIADQTLDLSSSSVGRKVSLAVTSLDLFGGSGTIIVSQ